ncbi:Clavaminate synthase-like protein [Stipitochalara longipes BDJ]|nr:Clavaminate synthase-like protein [Stipitochalara longipes BDJ]
MDISTVAQVLAVSYAKLLRQDKVEIDRLLSAAKHDGVFYLSFDGFSLSEELRGDVNALFKIGEETMENEKDELGRCATFAGDEKILSTRYRGPGMQIVDDEGHRDRTEFINVLENDLLLSSEPLALPSSINEARSTFSTFAVQCFNITLVLLSSLEVGFGMPPGTLTSMHSNLRANSNRVAVTRSVIRDARVEGGIPALGAHQDAGTLTVLFNRLGGLELMQAGEWRPIPARPECAVINVGKALSACTSDLLHAPLHRVMAPPAVESKSRYSVAYFLRPDHEAQLSIWNPRQSNCENSLGSDLTSRAWGIDWHKGRLEAVRSGKLDNYAKA